MYQRLEHVVRGLVANITRRAIARLLSTFLCCVLVVIRPFSRLGGPYAFLVLTQKELVFSAQVNLSEQLEITALNILGILIGIGMSALGIHLSSLLGRETVRCRALQAFWLVMVIFIASGLKSRLPRLGFSTRICMFVSAFMLTVNIGNRGNIWSESGSFLWVGLSAAAVSLISSALVLEWSSAGFTWDIADGFALLRQCLDALQSGSPCDQQTQNKLFVKSVALNANYQQASFELRFGRLSVKSAKPFIAVVEHLRREVAWGNAYTSSSSQPGDGPFQASIIELCTAVARAISVVEESIRVCYSHTSVFSTGSVADASGPAEMKNELMEIDRGVRFRLQRHVDHSTATGQIIEKEALPPEMWNMCLLMVSLLQMSQELQRALDVAVTLTIEHSHHGARLWFPRLTVAWLGVSPRYVMLLDSAYEDAVVSAAQDLSSAEAQQGIRETERDGENLKHSAFVFSPASFVILGRQAWASRRILRARLALSAILRSMRESPHLKHALKNAAGVAALSFPAFLPSGSTGRSWFASAHGQWMVITYFWILETTTGATWRSGYVRIAGTILGAVYGYVTWLICQENPYGLVALITLSEAAVTWFILHTAYPPVGVVAAITIPPIALGHYINQSSTQPIITIAVDRGLMIGAGIIAALLVNSFVFPRHARVLFLQDTSELFGLMSSYYLELSRDTVDAGSHAHRSRRHVLRIELKGRTLLHRLGGLLTALADELSLSPKPIRRYQRILGHLQRTLDLLVGIRRVREHIPRKITVTDVLQQRVELMSCICMAFHAAEHAFRSRQPLPQFLPSARHALKMLQLRIRENGTDLPSATSLPAVYAVAEQELLVKLVDELEGILALTRELFGAAAWLDVPPPSRPGSGLTTPVDEGGHELGWFSTVSFRASAV